MSSRNSFKRTVVPVAVAAIIVSGFLIGSYTYDLGSRDASSRGRAEAASASKSVFDDGYRKGFGEGVKAAAEAGFFNRIDPSDIILAKVVGVVKEAAPVEDGYKIVVNFPVQALNRTFTETFYSKQSLKPETVVQKLVRGSTVNVKPSSMNDGFSQDEHYWILLYESSPKEKWIKVFTQPTELKEVRN